MSIEAEKVGFQYGKGRPVLENISLSIKEGEFVGIFGPNGGGKTTLLRLLLGLLKPQKGSVRVFETKPEKVSDQIGYVPQMRRFDQYFPISVKEVVLQGLLASYRGWGSFSKEQKEAAMEALERVGLVNLASSPFGTLSGGQMQRTLIARALVAKPRALLLDEATAGIDPETLEVIFRLLMSLKKKITILLVTHELQQIAHEMDQLLCINKTATPYSASQVCQHFALGLYHPSEEEPDV